MEAVGTHVALRSSQLCLYQNWSSALLVFGVPSVPLIQCAFPLLFSCKCAAFKKAFASHYPLLSPAFLIWSLDTPVGLLLPWHTSTLLPDCFGFSQDRVGS